LWPKHFNRPQTIVLCQDRYLLKKADLFDFDMPLTVHKASGSQAKRVIVLESALNKCLMGLATLLYTAVNASRGRTNYYW
jgi:hypothetical protein